MRWLIDHLQMTFFACLSCVVEKRRNVGLRVTVTFLGAIESRTSCRADLEIISEGGGGVPGYLRWRLTGVSLQFSRLLYSFGRRASLYKL